MKKLFIYESEFKDKLIKIVRVSLLVVDFLIKSGTAITDPGQGTT